MMYLSICFYYCRNYCTPFTCLPRKIAYIFISTYDFSKGEQIEQKYGEGVALASWFEIQICD